MSMNIPSCNPPRTENVPTDPAPPYCREDQNDCDSTHPSLKDVSGKATSWLDEFTNKKEGIGNAVNCDPILKGHIINDQDGKVSDRSTVYRYAKSIRGTNDAVKDMFTDLIVEDENGKAHPVPIIWGSQEKAVQVMIAENYRKDNSTVVDRIKLPMMAIYNSTVDPDPKRYVYHKAVNYLRDYKDNWNPGFTVKEKFERDTVYGLSRGLPVNVGYELVVWTAYEEDMGQIFEQIYQRCFPMGYIRVRGLGVEIPVKLESVANNVEREPGDRSVRVIKYQFNMTAESYIAQPISRHKSILKTKIDLVNSPNEEEITEILSSLEDSVEELSE